MIPFYILEGHLEEMDFLWGQSTNALGELAYNFGSSAGQEGRLLVYLDGLLLAEADALDLLQPKLTEGDRDEALAATSLALASRETGYRDEPTKVLDQPVGPVERNYVCGSDPTRRSATEEVCPLPLERQRICLTRCWSGSQGRRLAFQLPGVPSRKIHLELLGGVHHDLTTNLETVIINTDDSLLFLIWRTHMLVRRGPQDVVAVQVSAGGVPAAAVAS